MYADIEQAIVDRLAAKLPGTVRVVLESDLARTSDLRQFAPAVAVIYDGYTVGATIGGGAVQQVQQEWFVVVCAKSAVGNGKTNEARNAAAATLEQVLAALLGFHIGGGRYLRLADAPGAQYDAGYCTVPLAFTIAATFKGQP